MAPRTKENLLVIGATGSTGYSALETLLENKEICEKYKVLAGVYRNSRNIDKVVNLIGFENVSKFDANLDDSALDECFRNVNVVYLIPSSSGRRVKQMENCIEAAKRNNVNFILLFSNIRLQDLKLTKIDRDYSKMEEMVVDSTIPYSIIRCGLLQQTLNMFSSVINSGKLTLPFENGTVSLLNVGDVNKFACKILLNPTEFSNRAFHITGDKLLSGNDIAEIASKALAKDIKYVESTLMDARDVMIQYGLDSYVAELMYIDGFCEWFDLIAQGKFEYVKTALLTLHHIELTPLSEYFKTAPNLSKDIESRQTEARAQQGAQKTRREPIEVGWSEIESPEKGGLCQKSEEECTYVLEQMHREDLDQLVQTLSVWMANQNRLIHNMSHALAREKQLREEIAAHFPGVFKKKEFSQVYRR